MATIRATTNQRAPGSEVTLLVSTQAFAQKAFLLLLSFLNHQIWVRSKSIHSQSIASRKPASPGRMQRDARRKQSRAKTARPRPSPSHRTPRSAINQATSARTDTLSPKRSSREETGGKKEEKKKKKTNDEHSGRRSRRRAAPKNNAAAPFSPRLPRCFVVVGLSVAFFFWLCFISPLCACDRP